MKLPSGWYAILDIKEIPKNKPIGIERLGKNLVIWRDDQNNIVVLDDHCPHRSAKLSLGQIKNGYIECPFHGFQFDGQGTCQFVPELKRAVTDFRAKKYITREKENFLWLWHGQAEPTQEIPWFNNLNASFSLSYFKKRWEKHVTRCIENQLDYAHLPFVHRNSIGRFSDPTIKAQFINSEKGVNVFFEEKKDSGFELLFPNIWQLRISKKMLLVLAFVPIHNGATEIYLRTYQSFFTVPFISKIMGPLMNLSNRYILYQDKQVVYSQLPEVTIEAKHEKLFNSDRAIMHFRQWWESKSL